MSSQGCTRLLRGDGSHVLRVLVLIAFCLQSFLIQTHVHPVPLAAPAAGQTTVSAPHDVKLPLDADHCLLCQEYVHAGAYVMPAIAAALPPNLAVGVVALWASPLLLSKPVSHNWMGRAPPRA